MFGFLLNREEKTTYLLTLLFCLRVVLVIKSRDAVIKNTLLRLYKERT